MTLSCTVSEILSLISQKVKRLRDSEHVPFRGNISRMQLVLLCINQFTKFEMPSFTNYKDVTGAKFKNGSRDSDHASFRGGLLP